MSAMLPSQTRQRPLRGSPKRSKDPAILFAYHVRNACQRRGPSKVMLVDGKARVFRADKEDAPGTYVGTFTAAAALDSIAQAWRDAMRVQTPSYVFSATPDRGAAVRKRLVRMRTSSPFADVEIPVITFNFTSCLSQTQAAAAAAFFNSQRLRGGAFRPTYGWPESEIDAYLAERLAAGMVAS